jgi:predicted metal-dependent hydrolase
VEFRAMVFDQLNFLFPAAHAEETSSPEIDFHIEAGGRQLPVEVRTNERARRYIVYMRADGTVTLTVPRRGSVRMARQFLESKVWWLERQLRKRGAGQVTTKNWTAGTEVLLHGQVERIEVVRAESPCLLRLGPVEFTTANPVSNLRPLVESHLQNLARAELPPRAHELALLHQIRIGKVTVRDQSSRWGSCSPQANISLNWRLIQAPAEVRDYVILHELMHVREMNHSRRFWALVAQVCPGYEACERWLKTNAVRLGL